MTEPRRTGDTAEEAPMLIAYDGSAHAGLAITAAAAVMPGRPALVLTVWRSIGRAAAAARIALTDDFDSGGRRRA